MDTVTINRAPVITLWAAVVAEQLGFERDEVLAEKVRQTPAYGAGRPSSRHRP